MSRRAMQVSAVLALLLMPGCTEHGGGPAQVDEGHEPELSTVSPSSPELEWSPEPSRGPVTPLYQKPFAGALGEVTGDGQVDVVALCHVPDTAALVVLGGLPDGRFVEGEPEFVDGSGVALGDLDGDGDLDALILDASGRPAYRVGQNDGAGRFSIGPKQRIRGRYGGELKGATLVDLDDDGDLDAVVPLWDTIRIMRGDGAGHFDTGTALAIGRDPFATALGDLDSDGQLDLVASSGAGPTEDRDTYESAGASVWIFRGRGRGRGFGKPERVELSEAKQVAIADLDGDGQLEVVVSGAGGLTVIRDALGEPHAERTLVASDGPLLLADVLDTTGVEMITTSYMQGRTHVLGGHRQLSRSSFEAGSFVVGLFAADVGRDGLRPDIVLLNAGPPGGLYGEPAPSIEVLFSSRML